MILAQIKFFDGKLYDYTDQELEQLKSGFKKLGKEQTKSYLINQILHYRFSDEMAFPGSQLATEIFS